MKNITGFLLTILAIGVTFSGCIKIIDEWHANRPSQKACRIIKVTQSHLPVAGETRTGLFYYDWRGNLDSVIFDLHTGTGSAQLHYFFYDWQNRLIGYRSDYSRNPGDYYWLHKYVWENNIIVRDSIWLRGAGLDTIVIDLEYDAMDRVTTETRRMIFPTSDIPDGQPETTHYQYDNNGNLVNATQSVYDDKQSYISTNPVLQFIHRDYSKNNPAGAFGYNFLGLPTGFGRIYSGTPGFFDWGHPQTIEYACPPRQLDRDLKK
jgi:hypothetical protein